MKTVKYEAGFDGKAGRLELLIRFLWYIPSYIVLFVLVVIAMVAYVVQFLHILVLGKRNKALFDWTLKYVSYRTKLESYFFLLTEERNPILPEA